MSQNGIYLYGFADLGQALGFQHPGHEEVGPALILELPGVAAIASPVPPGQIEAGLAQEPPDPEWIVPRALHHERVLESALQRGPVLPVRFGCVFTSRSALEEVTGRHLDVIRGFLRGMADREEWALKAFLDESRAVAALLDEDPVLSIRYRKLPTAPGTRYFLEKQLREEARRKSLRDGREAGDRLRQLIEERASGIKVLPLRSGEEGSRHPILNLAVLLDRRLKDDFFNHVDRAATARGEVPLAIERSGPWPPYHFCPNLGDPAT